MYIIFIPAPPRCEFAESPGRFLPYTDRFVPQAYDVSECRRLCEQERDFQCRSFSFRISRRECYLSSDDSFVADKNALINDRDFLYGEQSSCSNGIIYILLIYSLLLFKNINLAFYLHSY